MKKIRYGKDGCTVGIISDTHGLLRPEAVDALRGSDLIIHAGDIGNPSVLDELETLAPAVAVRGNMDTDRWSCKLKTSEVVELNDVILYIVHDIDGLALDPEVSSISVVISGHSHRPSVAKRKGILYVNPGSAGPRRFNLPVSVALLHIKGNAISAKVVRLKV